MNQAPGSCELGWKQNSQQAGLHCFCKFGLPQSAESSVWVSSALPLEAEAPKLRPAHLLGAVKAVPDTCSAYRPYGQTCKPRILSHLVFKTSAQGIKSFARGRREA